MVRRVVVYSSSPRQHQLQRNQCPATPKAKDTKTWPRFSKPAPSPRKKPPTRKPTANKGAPHSKLSNWRNTATLLRQSEQRTRSKRLQPDHPTKRHAKRGSTDKQEPTEHSTTGPPPPPPPPKRRETASAGESRKFR